MRKESGQIQLVMAIIICVVACGLLAGLGSWAIGRAPARTNDQSVDMIQPRGVNPEKDYANSQSNLNNSQSNLNNSEAQLNLAEATAVIIDAQGEYAVNIAQATAIVANSDQGPVNTYMAGQADGQADGMKTFGLSTVALVAIGFVVFLLLARR